MSKYDEVVVDSPPHYYYALLNHAIKNAAIATKTYFTLADKIRRTGDKQKTREMKAKGYIANDKILKYTNYFRDRIDETGKTVLHAREFDIKDDIINYLLRGSSETRYENHIFFEEENSTKYGEYSLFQDRGILRITMSTFLENIIDCGEGTEFSIKTFDEEEKREEKEFVRIVVENSIPESVIEKEGGWKMGLTFAEMNIALIGGNCGEQLFRKYTTDEGILKGKVEFSIPKNVKEYYTKSK
jgi:hypothetical protein